MLPTTSEPRRGGWDHNTRGRRELVLRSVREYQEANYGQAPSVRDLIRLTNIPSSGTISRYLRDLHRSGRLVKVRHHYLVPGKWEPTDAQKTARPAYS